MTAGKRWQPEEFAQPTLLVARALLGALLVHQYAGERLCGRIVETEAYLHDDEACHGVRRIQGMLHHRRTRRNAPMFGPPGHAYVYFSYGNHYLFNIVTAPEGIPEAVLIRAVEPLDGLAGMARRRGVTDTFALSSGPGKLTRAFAIDLSFNAHPLWLDPLYVLHAEPLPDSEVVVTTRVGISRATDRPWRFYQRGNPWVSRK